VARSWRTVLSLLAILAYAGDHRQIEGDMDDNVIKFRKRPEPPKAPWKKPVWLQKLLIAGGVILAFAVVYAYFSVMG
jgi:hypothetical protein